ncbi:exonuclease domain-containing protein [Sphingobium xenophagum]|uniref:Exodeoxyribonuclease I n=1 Tax=Sphingobium xenophagum TaxID=121428 RepID=A0A401IYF4_SPHXE|nr:exonuclease domain-containing protein [Sphingobium xenophagum]GBH29366.1 exodeoxyribonuclease I [Sphingobium xenophagum]
MGFVFYDTETTGTNTSFDQILQFAAIRTDDDLNELDRFEIRCRLMPHIVPSPGALCVTRISMEQITDPALPSHYEMMCEIRAKLAAWSPCIFTGWNTLGFDEHLLRQALYQSLHSPYLTNTGGNSRIDILKIAQAASVLVPDAIAVPIGDKGKPTFRLDRLAPANGFNHLNAHDALADVEATIHVARLIRDNAPGLWADAIRLADKASVAALLDAEPCFILTESFYNLPYQFALTKIGHEPGNAGTLLALNLAIDVEQLRAMTDEELAARLARSPKPVRRIRTNAAPTLQPSSEYSHFDGIAADDLRERALLIQADTEFCARLIRLSAKPDWPASEFVEEQIYSGFVSRADEHRMLEFHRAPWKDRPAIVGGFGDARLIALGRRLIYEHRPDLLPENSRAKIAAKIAERMVGGGNGKAAWTTIADAQAEAVARMEQCNVNDADILAGVLRYLASRLPPPVEMAVLS